MPPLIAMLSQGDIQLKEMAAFALGRLAQHADSQAGVVEVRCFPDLPTDACLGLAVCVRISSLTSRPDSSGLLSRYCLPCAYCYRQAALQSAVCALL